MMKSFGSDPEFMLKDSKGKLKSAIGVVPGSKEHRHILFPGYEVYHDNVLAECSIKPSFSKDEAIANFGKCLKGYAALVAPYTLNTQASGDYPAKECECKEAKEFGCDPELDAYEITVIEAPSPP